MIKYWNGQKGIAGEYLYAHFYEEGHKSIEDMIVKIYRDFKMLGCRLRLKRDINFRI